MKLATRLHAMMAGLALSLSVIAAEPDLALVVPANSPATSLSVAEAADIFLGKHNRYPDGSLARPVDQAIGSPQRTAFYYRLAGKSPAQMKAHWSALIFTGRGQPPMSVDNSAAVMQYLAQNPNAIGYVDLQTVDQSVVILRLLESNGTGR